MSILRDHALTLPVSALTPDCAQCLTPPHVWNFTTPAIPDSQSSAQPSSALKSDELRDWTACSPIRMAKMPHPTAPSRPYSPDQSHVAAQHPPPDHIWSRWRDEMAVGNFTRSHFRESSQWTALTREHAQLISDDAFVLDRFLAKCPPNVQ